MFYHYKIHKENDGYWAECVELDGAFTQAKTMVELKINMEEALNLYLDEPAESRLVFPLPKKNIKGKNILKVPVNPKIAFGVMMRHLRDKNHLTQRQIANKLGMKDIYSYQRLEKSSNPTLTTLVRIKKEFPGLSIDDLITS